MDDAIAALHGLAERLGVADVLLDDLNPVLLGIVEVGDVVGDDLLDAARLERPDQIDAEETGSACDEHLHAIDPFVLLCPAILPHLPPPLNTRGLASTGR